MRAYIVMSMLVASLAAAGTWGFEEERKLDLPAAGIGHLEIDSGAGSLVVRGVEGAESIRVRARIRLDEGDVAAAREYFQKHGVLTLERHGDAARLRAGLDSRIFGFTPDGVIDLEVELPVGMRIDVDDSSGSVVIRETRGDVDVEDSSGSLTIEGVANVEIEDGSGSVEVRDASGDVSIEDGSGSITVLRVGGSVRIDDGSGSIRIANVQHDVVIDDSGSGGVSIEDVRGSVTTDDD